MTPRIIVSGTRMARVRPSTITILKPSRILLPLVVVRAERWLPRAAGRWRDGEAAVQRLLPLPLPLLLISGAPPQPRSGRTSTPDGRTRMCGVLSRGRGTPAQLPPAPRTPRNAPSAKTGCERQETRRGHGVV